MELRVGVDEILEVVLVLQLLLRDQEVKLHTVSAEVLGHGSKPRELLLCFLEVALQVQLHVHGLDPVALPRDLGHNRIAPVHQRHLLVVLQCLSIIPLNHNLAAKPEGSAAQLRVLLVQRYALAVGCGWATGQRHRHGFALVERSEPLGNGVDDLLVDGPDLIPFHQVVASATALRQNKLLQTLNGQTMAQDTSDSREAWVIPPLDRSILHKPRQLSLAHERVCHVQTAVVIHNRTADFQGGTQPLILFLSVAVFVCAQGVGHTLHAIDDWAGEIVRGVELVLVLSAEVGGCVAAVQHGVTHAPVKVFHVDLGTQRTLHTLL
eukprot:comp22933_c0_seq1/m.36331 comp22933_c0_seq1/g.36331  ORF comp22933_c0_seq1/g.36331 comp22933_c0_seq1/m.36331 type:complete len:322 (+) comp22933_c0_seq1:2467-3432(+)